MQADQPEAARVRGPKDTATDADCIADGRRWNAHADPHNRTEPAGPTQVARRNHLSHSTGHSAPAGHDSARHRTANETGHASPAVDCCSCRKSAGSSAVDSDATSRSTDGHRSAACDDAASARTGTTDCGLRNASGSIGATAD
uniref:(northern house mosquito) hypothetical protein n=1 Tax=Culex pipiens TaxID=7175 RepID=A0A8D7ZW83_CULPI